MAEANPGYRIVRGTGKRQFTVPKAYFEKLRLGNKVRCYLEGNRLIIEPINEDLFWDFSTETLQALVAEGYEGENLVREFEARKEKVTPGV